VCSRTAAAGPDREEPGPQICAGFPEMLLAQRADECLLHEVIGANGVAGQRPGIAPEPRNFLFQMMVKLIHDHPSSAIQSKANAGGRNYRINSGIPVGKEL
jgi:hypothetical protein